MKNKNHRIISTDTEICLTHTPTPTHKTNKNRLKREREREIERNFFNLLKGIYEKPAPNITFNNCIVRVFQIN